jgi:hypothetical protein
VPVHHLAVRAVNVLQTSSNASSVHLLSCHDSLGEINYLVRSLKIHCISTPGIVNRDLSVSKMIGWVHFPVQKGMILFPIVSHGFPRFLLDGY